MPRGTPIQKNIFGVKFMFDLKTIEFSCQSISSLSIAREIGEWREGFMLFHTASFYGNLSAQELTLSRNKFQDRADIESLSALLLMPFEVYFKTEISLYSSFNFATQRGNPARRYLLAPCILTSITLANELDSNDRGFVVEEITIRYHALISL